VSLPLHRHTNGDFQPRDGALLPPLRLPSWGHRGWSVPALLKQIDPGQEKKRKKQKKPKPSVTTSQMSVLMTMQTQPFLGERPNDKFRPTAVQGVSPVTI